MSEDAPGTPARKITIERTYEESIDVLWGLWTTKEGIESWWGPEGFVVEVKKIDFRPGGKLRYVMTATAAPQIEFLKRAALPLSTELQVTYTEVVPKERLAYKHAVEFIPGVETYDVATQVEFHSDGQRVRVVLTIDAMHDDEWTRRSVMGEESQLGKLEGVIRGLRSYTPRVPD
jgi:uncharacterized protein YndB with AHSA1/START domain